MKYTLVSHSGLDNNVELCALNSATVKRVIEVKGFVFDSFDDADKIEYIANYRGVTVGQIVGDATKNGRFHDKTIDGKNIFIPNADFKSYANRSLA